MILSERSRMIIFLICEIEQMITLVGSVWLIGWHQWSPWWMLLSLNLMVGGSPSVVIKAVSK